MNKHAKTQTIMMAGGGTGGHITPLVSLAHEIKATEPDCQLVYVGYSGEHTGDSLDAKLFNKVYAVNAGKLRRYPLTPKTIWLNLSDIPKTLIGIIEAAKLIDQLKPDVLFSKGGFVSLPVAIAARLNYVPIVTHDSDTVPGLANRLVGRWATAHATGMPTSFYNYPTASTYFTGVPVSEKFSQKLTPGARIKLSKKLGIAANSKILLIVGGSLGAKSLNQNLPAISRQLLDQDPKLHFIHISGQHNLTSVKAGYKKALTGDLLKRVTTLGLANNLAEIVSLADLVVTRAGATTLAELALAAKSCLVVPSPYLSGGHQLKNAEWYSQHNAVELLDNNASTEVWLQSIAALLNANKKRTQLSKNLAKLAKPNASTDLAKLILSVAEQGQV